MISGPVMAKIFLNSEEDLMKEINYDAFFQDITSKDIKNWKILIQ